MSEWQPIETAPRDGSVILLWRYYPVAGYWDERNQYPWQFVGLGAAYYQLERNGAYAEDAAITHWMPLPDPPQGA